MSEISRILEAPVIETVPLLPLKNLGESALAPCIVIEQAVTAVTNGDLNGPAKDYFMGYERQ